MRRANTQAEKTVASRSISAYDAEWQRFRLTVEQEWGWPLTKGNAHKAVLDYYTQLAEAGRKFPSFKKAAAALRAGFFRQGFADNPVRKDVCAFFYQRMKHNYVPTSVKEIPTEVVAFACKRAVETADEKRSARLRYNVLLYGHCTAKRPLDVAHARNRHVCFDEVGMATLTPATKNRQQTLSRGMAFGNNPRKCPVTQLRKWYNDNLVFGDSAFLFWKKSPEHVLTHQEIASLYREVCDEAGFDWRANGDFNSVAGTSTRRGAAHTAYANGASKREVAFLLAHKKPGRHTERYLPASARSRKRTGKLLGLD